jgi:hypothetical protein
MNLWKKASTGKKLKKNGHNNFVAALWPPTSPGLPGTLPVDTHDTEEERRQIKHKLYLLFIN